MLSVHVYFGECLPLMILPISFTAALTNITVENNMSVYNLVVILHDRSIR